jgi:anti-sigma factor RsiW
MNCRHCQTLLLREADRLGSAAVRAKLEAHLAACPDCRSLQADLRNLSREVRADLHATPVPDVAEEWRQLRRTLQSDRPAATTRQGPAAWWWIAPPLAAAAAGALLFLAQTPRPSGVETASPDAAMVTAQAEYVEPGDANAATMVFVDKPSGWLVVWASDTPPARKG